MVGRELSKWYASHAIVRRLWAMESGEAIRVVVTLEPTLDGDDTQPAWLANSWTWAQELRLRLQRIVHLELINEPSVRVEATCDGDDALDHRNFLARPDPGGRLITLTRRGAIMNIRAFVLTLGIALRCGAVCARAACGVG